MNPATSGLTCRVDLADTAVADSTRTLGCEVGEASGLAMRLAGRYPHSVAKVAELLAEGRSVCVILGDHESVTTTWDDDDIFAIAKKVELEPRDDDNLAYLGWEAGGTVDQPVVAGTITVTTRKANVELYSAFTDEELHDWLVWAGEHGTSFLHAIAEAAFVSDLRDYYSLRPTLKKLKRMYPETM